jgi:hypothetical protein
MPTMRVLKISMALKIRRTFRKRFGWASRNTYELNLSK